MNEGDEVLYTIVVEGINGKVAEKSASDKLVGAGVPRRVQIATPGRIDVPRLYTRWGDDEQEQAWQANLRHALESTGLTVMISAVPWTPAPGYPVDTMEETKP